MRISGVRCVSCLDGFLSTQQEGACGSWQWIIAIVRICSDWLLKQSGKTPTQGWTWTRIRHHQSFDENKVISDFYRKKFSTICGPDRLPHQTNDHHEIVWVWFQYAEALSPASLGAHAGNANELLSATNLAMPSGKKLVVGPLATVRVIAKVHTPGEGRP